MVVRRETAFRAIALCFYQPVFRVIFIMLFIQAAAATDRCPTRRIS